MSGTILRGADNAPLVAVIPPVQATDQLAAMREACARVLEDAVRADRDENGRWADHQRNYYLDALAGDIRNLTLPVSYGGAQS